MSPVAALVLAAGRSRRFGRANKLLAPLGGEPLWWPVLASACASRARPVIVVTGHEAPALRRSLAQFRSRYRPRARIRLVFNRRYRSGLASSLQAGLRALPPASAGALVCLGDMPGVDAALLDRLIAGFGECDAAVIPTLRGRRGNPVLLGRALFAAVQTLQGDEGARRLLAREPRLRLLETGGARAVLRDIDTRRDWLAARRQRV